MNFRNLRDPQNLLLSLLIRLPNCKQKDKWLLSLRFRQIFGRTINWKNLQTYSEKLQWLKVYNRPIHHTIMVDKYAAKGWIADRVGSEYVIPTLGIWDSFDDIDFNSLPEKFVLKTTHDSGGIVVVKKKEILDYQKAKSKLEDSLARNYYTLFREWAYKDVPPRIIAEQYLEDESGGLIDYKFFCFNGEPKAMFIATDRFSQDGLKMDFYDLDFNHLPFERCYPNSHRPISKPALWDKMIELARILSKDEYHLRVDFFCANDKLYVGELTLYPGAGMESFQPDEWDYKFGQWLKLPINK